MEEEIKKLKHILQRCKELMEPFPAVLNHLAVIKTIREKHKKTDVRADIEARFKKYEAKNKKTYRDILKALKN